MAGKRKVRRQEPKVRWDPREDIRYMNKVEKFRRELRAWVNEESLTVADVSRKSGVSQTAIARILNEGNDWSKRTMAPKFSTMYRLALPAGIEIEFRRRKRRVRKPKTPVAGIRKNRGYARRGRR